MAGFKLVCAKGAWLYHEGAGHVKNESQKNKEPFEAAVNRRMQLVGRAYSVFREKWAPDLPPNYHGPDFRSYVQAAERNPDPSKVRYDMPTGVIERLRRY
jgi:hypothetical protein